MSLLGRGARVGAALAVRQTVWIGGLTLFIAGPAQHPLGAQSVTRGAGVSGVVLDAESGSPIAGATVRVAGGGVAEVTRADGRFRLVVADSPRSLVVERLGYASVVLDIAQDDRDALRIELSPSPLDLQGLVVTGALTERAANETIRPASVLAGKRLQLRLQGTVAATLTSEPGFSATTMGPAAARPVIRGMSGDRVLVLEDGARVGDVSNTHSDHATALDPASARRLEVVRGPAALLYGSNALGGVVNVIRDEIPFSVPFHPTGTATAQARTVNEGYGLSANVLTGLTPELSVRVEGTGRTSGDLDTPAGRLSNTFAESWEAAAGASWIDEWGSVGGAVRAYRSDYGVPGGFVGGHASGVRIEMERTVAKLRARIGRPVGPFRSVQIDGLSSAYRHREFETGDILGTIFERALGSAEVLARHGPFGPLSAGAIGVRASGEELQFKGALQTPDSRRYAAAVLLLEELNLGRLRIETGARYDWVRIDPRTEDPTSSIGNVRARTFHAASGSLGILYEVAGGLIVGASLAQAFRPPDIGELFSEGPHLAVYAYEVGNPELGTEVGRGFDAFVRFASDAFEAEWTGFYNDIRGYVYAENTGRLSRVQLPVYQFGSRDAVLTGFEGALHWPVSDHLRLDATGSFVRGSLKESHDPLPLIPPLQGRAVLAYDRAGWFVSGEAEFAAEQGRVGEFEQATSGYAVYHGAAGVRLPIGGRSNVLTLRLENVTDRTYRNHLSRVKEIMPQAGRGVFLTYRVVF